MQTPGTNDNDVAKIAHLEAAIETSDAVLAIVERNLQNGEVRRKQSRITNFDSPRIRPNF